MATNGTGKQETKAAQATAKRLAALEAKVDELCDSIDDLTKVVRAEALVS